MIYQLVADAVLVVHLLFILFVVFGGLCALRTPWAALIHLPAAVWGAVVELAGRICPLTPLEIGLRQAAGAAGYTGGFIEHYLVPIIYPAALTRDVQWFLGMLVLLINVAIYTYVIHHYRRRRTRAG